MPDIVTDYINTTDYTKLENKIINLNDVCFDLQAKLQASRKLRYAEIDIEVERKAQRLAPDELYVPQHVIDTNIRREQSSYIQYITQSPRAVILKDKDDPSVDLSVLEVDLTEKLRFDGWQLSAYANIDGFQANGYGIIEVVQDLDNEGKLSTEYVQLGDFAFVADTRDIQKAEMHARAYYFTRTKLVSLRDSKVETERWDRDEVNKIIESEPNDEQTQIYSGTATINRSLYKVLKVYYRINGIVHVAWACPKFCKNWLRKPRPLMLGRRKLADKANSMSSIIKLTPAALLKPIQALSPEIKDSHIQQIKDGLPASDAIPETDYPFFLYPYLISENDTVAALKGRIFLDQDTQNAASSLMSSLLTKARRSAGLYFAKETNDPNDDFLIQKNIYFKTGAIINGKLKEMELSAPDASLFSAVNVLVSANQQETSQVNFAETNRQNDSRKTATAIKASIQQQQQLSGTQVTLYSNALRAQYMFMCEIIKSRVLAGLIVVRQELMPLYQRNWKVKPSGDVDVIEKQQLIQMMQANWPVVQQTAAAIPFLTDLLEKQFPDSAAKYVQAINQQQQQAQSQQAQQMQQMVAMAKNAASSIIELSKHKDYFSEVGQLHAFPQIQQGAAKLEQLMQGQNQ